MSLQTSILRNLKFAFVALFALVFFVVPAMTASAKTKKAKYGTIKIQTNPGGLLLMIDGQPRGETKLESVAFDLDAGLHTVQVRLPNGKFWTRELELPAGRVKCVVVNYRPLPPLPNHRARSRSASLRPIRLPKARLLLTRPMLRIPAMLP